MPTETVPIDSGEAWGGAMGTRNWEITKVEHPTEGMSHESKITFLAPRGKTASVMLPVDDSAGLKAGLILPSHLRPES